MLRELMKSKIHRATITDAHKGEYKVMLQSSGRDQSAKRGTFPVARVGEHTGCTKNRSNRAPSVASESRCGVGTSWHPCAPQSA